MHSPAVVLSTFKHPLFLDNATNNSIFSLRKKKFLELENRYYCLRSEQPLTTKQKTIRSHRPRVQRSRIERILNINRPLVKRRGNTSSKIKMDFKF